MDSIESTAKNAPSYQAQAHIAENFYLGWAESSVTVAYTKIWGMKKTTA